MKVEKNRYFLHPPTSFTVIQRKETNAENGFKSPANRLGYSSVSQTFFKWGPLSLVRMFYGPLSLVRMF